MLARSANHKAVVPLNSIAVANATLLANSIVLGLDCDANNLTRVTVNKDMRLVKRLGLFHTL